MNSEKIKKLVLEILNSPRPTLKQDDVLKLYKQYFKDNNKTEEEYEMFISQNNNPIMLNCGLYDIIPFYKKKLNIITIKDKENKILINY